MPKSCRLAFYRRYQRRVKVRGCLLSVSLHGALSLSLSLTMKTCETPCGRADRDERDFKHSETSRFCAVASNCADPAFSLQIDHSRNSLLRLPRPLSLVAEDLVVAHGRGMEGIRHFAGDLSKCPNGHRLISVVRLARRLSFIIFRFRPPLLLTVFLSPFFFSHPLSRSSVHRNFSGSAVCPLFYRGITVPSAIPLPLPPPPSLPL